MNGQRAALITVSIGFEVIGICLTVYAILSSSWQTVNLGASMHEHGLWNFTFSEFTRCYYKFDFERNYGNFDPEYLVTAEVGRHRFFGWHKAVIIILCIALCTAIFCVLNGLINLVILCIGLCFPRLSEICALPFTFMFTVTVLMTTTFAWAAQITFYWFATRPANKFIGSVEKIEQKFGIAFYIQMFACLMDLLATIMALLSAGQLYFHWKQRRSSEQRIYLRY